MPAIAGSRHGKVSPTRSIFRTRPACVGQLALLAALLAAGCGRITTQAGTSGTRTPATPTATRIAATPTAMLPPAPLSWADVSPPPGFLLPGAVESTLGMLSISQGDGATAYACARAASLSVGATIWVTHDRGQHWTRLAPLPLPTIPRPLTYCWVVPDAVDPNIAVAEVSWNRPQANGEPYYAEGTHVVTFDGGQSWQPLHGPQPFYVIWLATYHGTTMADVGTTPPGDFAFWISDDQMHNWQSSSAAAVYAGDFDFKINPTTGTLLAVSGIPAAGIPERLGTSDDFGRHWTTLSTLPNWTPAVFQPAGSQPWRICGFMQDTSQSSGVLMCSIDGGKTWTERPQLESTSTNPSGGQSPETADVVAVGADGTVYADMSWITPDTLYRLLPGSDRWQSLGTSPVDLLSPDIGYATADLPGIGIFWYSRSYNELQLFNP